jgi:signal transduction histidine kinase
MHIDLENPLNDPHLAGDDDPGEGYVDGYTRRDTGSKLTDPQASLTAEQRDDISAIHLGGGRMLTLITQLLDLSRIEAGRLELVRRPVHLATILDQVRQDAAPLALQKGLDLCVEVPEGVPPVLGDAERLRQILLNLAATRSSSPSTGRWRSPRRRPPTGSRWGCATRESASPRRPSRRSSRPFARSTAA